jgi:hypothetical protein
VVKWLAPKFQTFFFKFKIKIITGYLAVEGSNRNNSLRPTTLGFLENLELIEGRQTYFGVFLFFFI